MKLSKLTTPTGVAAFPWLNEPDKKFDSQRAKGGEYHVDLRLSAEDGAPLVKRLENILAEWKTVKNNEQKEAKKKPYKTYHATPWSEVEDEEGNPTGEYVFKFKRGAEWTDRDGNVRKNLIRFVDSKGEGITKLSDTVGSGSKLRICFQVRGWASPLGISVALDLVAVQIVELVAFSGGGGSEEFGFGEVDGGFIAEATTETAEASEDGDF